MKRVCIRAALAALLTVSTGLAVAQGRTLKFGNQNAKGHPIVVGMEKFAQLVEAKTGGKLKVTVVPGGALGTDQASLAALAAGTQDMAAMNSGILASLVKDFAVYDFPFMFSTPAEADAVVDGAIGKGLHARLEDKGLVGLTYYELGFRNITNSKRPINTADDIAGLKLRVIPNPINQDWVAAVGAIATPMPFNELYAALEQKTVDGQENPVATIQGAKLYEVQKHLALTNHQYNPQSVLISKKVWDSLSADEKKAVQDAAVESARFQRQQSRTAAEGILEALKKQGMQVTELPPEEITKIRNKVKPVINKYGRDINDTMMQVLGEVSKLRK